MQDELISRQAAIDAVNDVIADYVPNLFGRYEALPLEMASTINRLPSVNPQPKIGHWIEYDHGLGAKYYRCSICKGFEDGEKGKYCKWCGAKMVEQQESEVIE